MIQLFLDTSSHHLVIVILKDNKKIYELIESSDNKISNTLLSKIDTAIKEANINIKKIDEIYVVNGPGSFTGIRIGIAFAKITGYLLKTKLIPISELELLSTGNKGYTLSLIDAKRGYVYAGLYDDMGNNIINDQHIYMDDLLKMLDKYRDLDIKNVSYDKFENIECIEPKIDIEQIILRHKNDEGINPHSLNPNYLKKTEAEEKLNDKRS